MITVEWGSVGADGDDEAVRGTAKRGEDGLDRILARQESVITQSQALASGMTRSALRHRIRPGGPWQELLPRTYLAATGSPTLAQMEVAAVLYAGRDSVLTGLAALRRHGLRVSPAAEIGVSPAAEISVLIPAGQASRGRRSRAFVTVRPTRRMPAPICYRGVVQYVLPERALVDAARELHSFRQLRALVADAVQQRYCRLDVLRQELRSEE